MASRSWIRNLFARPVTRPIRKAAAAPRLRVEPLEDRCVPDATVTGTAAADHFRVRPGAHPGTVEVSSDNGTFAPRTLVNLTGTLTLQPGAEDDTITVEPLGGQVTFDVKVTDPDRVTLRSMTLPGSLMVSAVTITVADGANIQSAAGDITLTASDTAKVTYPLSSPALRDKQASAGITIGSATLTGKNVTLSSFASTDKLAKTDVSQDTRAVALADVNGDGRPDLITAATDAGTGGGLGGPLLLFLNTGNPLDPFEGATPQTICRGDRMTSLAVGDVTGDGRPDLVVGSAINPDLPGTFIYSRLFVNTGNSGVPFQFDPNYNPAINLTYKIGTGQDITTSVALADVNADGKMDLVMGNGAFSSPANGLFFAPTRLYLNQGGQNPFAGAGIDVTDPRANTVAVALADVTGDGRPDLITANVATVMSPSPSLVYVNQGGANPFGGFRYSLGGDGKLPVTSIATGDLDQDGRADIVLGVNGQPSQVFFSALGIEAPPVLLGTTDAVKGVAVADANGDGRLDVVTAVAGVSRVYLNNGLGSPFTTFDLVSDGFTSNGVAAVAAADLNRDGRPDLAVVGKDAPPLVFVNNRAARPYTEATVKPVSLDPTLTRTIDLPFLGTKGALASVVTSKADSSILVNGGASITATAGNVVIDSKALAAAANTTVGVFLGFTSGDSEPTATARLLPGAKVSATGVFQLTARTNSILDVSVTTVSPMLVNIDIAHGKSRSEATATVGAGAEVTAGSATVSADAQNSLSTSAGGFLLTFGTLPVSGGIGIAVTDYSSTATAQMDGTLTTTGDAKVTAEATNTSNSTEASASVLSVARTLIGAGKSVQGIGESVKKLAPLTASLSGLLQGGGYLLGMVAGGTAQFAAAAGIAWVTSELNATAGVGGKVTVPGNLLISGRTEDNVKVVATGSAGNADKLSLGGGLAVTNLTNTATAAVAPGADLAVGGQLHVVSDAVVPNPLSASLPAGFRFVPPPDTTGTPTSNDADRVANAYQMGQATADGFRTYLFNTIVPIVTGILFGNTKALGTTFVKGTGEAEVGQAGGSVGIGGGINVFRLNNTSTATIGKGARVNQRSPGAGVSLAGQDVWVEADTTVITINLGNQVSGTNPKGPAAGGSAAVGGQFEYIGHTNKAQAYIDDGAIVSATRDLKVTANTFNYLMTVIQSGAAAKAVGVGGTLSIHDLRNQTLAYAEDGAILNAGRDLQVLAGNQLQVFNAAGGLTQGGDVGFGVSAVANLLQQNDTFAFLGDHNAALQAGTVTAGRNVDVKATADTVVVGVAFSGASANGMADQLEEPSGPDTFSSFKQWGAARLAYLNSLNPKGGIGVSGDAVVNGLVSDTRAYIRGPGSVVAGNDLTVAARDTSLFAAASGAIATGNSSGFAGSVAVNTVKRTTRAFADGATRLTAGNLAVSAVSIETPVTVSVGAGKAQDDSAVAGSVSVTAVDSTTAANLAAIPLVTTTRPSTLFDRAGVAVTAFHSATTYSVAGVAAGTAEGAAAVGLAADIAVMTGEGTTANLGGQVSSAGDVKVFATDSQTLFGVAAGLAAAVKDGAGAAGSASVGSIKQTAIASIAKFARVDAASSVRVDADGRLYDLRVAGGVAGGKKAGVGGAATVNLVPDRTVRAVIDDFARVRASGANRLVLEDPQGILGAGIVGVAVNAATSDTLLLFAAAGAVSPGTLALAGTVTVDLLTNNTTEARIGARAEVGPGDNAAPEMNVYLNALHQTNAVTVAGSLAGAKTAGVGAAGVIETIDRDVRAVVDSSAKVAAKGVAIVDAAAGMRLTSVAGALAGGRDAAVAGSAVVQTLSTDTLAAVGDLAQVEARLARVTADNTVVSTAVAGQMAGSQGVGIGASNASIIQTDTTIARIGDRARVTTTGAGWDIELTAPTGRRFADGRLIREPIPGLAVVATAQEKLTPVAVGAAGGRVGLAGSLSLSVLDLTTEAKVGQGADLDTPLSLIASDDTTISGAGGAAALGSTAGIGAGMDVQTVKKRTRATLDSSAARPTLVNSSRPGDVVVLALSTGTQLSTSAAVGIGLQAGLAGGASGMRVDNATLATIGPAAVVTSQSNLIVSAEDTTNLTSVAGALSAGKLAGIGAAAGVAVVTKDTQATVGAGAKLTANATGPTALVADGGFQAGAPEPVGGTFNPGTQVFPWASSILLNDHQFTPGAGQAVVYRAGDAAPDIGLVDGQTYYVIVVNPYQIKLASTAELARAGVSDVVLKFSSQVNKTSSLLPAGKGPIEFGSALPVTSRVPAILARRNLVPTQRAASGVAVTAVNLDRVESFAAAAGGGTVAFQLAAAVDVITSKAIASVGDNAVVTTPNTGAVLVAAGNELFHLGAGGAAGIGKVAVAPGVHIPVVNMTTTASIGNSAKVTAGLDVEVRANASQDLLSIAVGLAGSLGASVGGSASIVSVTSHTSATTGTGSQVRAGGSVVVTANDTTHSGVIDGAAAVGALGGLGGAVGVTYVEKNTRAALGVNSLTSGDAVDGLVFLAIDPTQPLTDGSLPRRSMKGVLVQALASQDLFAVGAAGAGGKYGALAGAITVGTVKSNTTAEVGDGAQVNTIPAVAGRAVAADQDVAVTAVDTTRAFGAAGTLAIAGGALAGGVDVAIINPNVLARVGVNAAITAARDVAVGGLSHKDVQSAAISAAGGAVGVAGAVSVVSAGSSLSSDAQRSLKANDGGNSATTTGYLEELALNRDVVGLLGNYRSDSTSNDAERRAAIAIGSLSGSVQVARPIGKATVSFFSGGGLTSTLVSAGSTITAGRAVAVAGRDRLAIDQTTGSLAAGLAAFGGAVSVATVADHVDVRMAGSVSAGGDVTVAADYDSKLGGGAGAGLGKSSNGVTVGLIGLGAQVTRITDNSSTGVSLSGSVARAGTLTVDSARDRTLNASAQGVTVGGVVVGVAQAKADAGGHNTATISGQVGQGAGLVNDLVVNVRSLTFANANTKAVAAGVLAGAGSDASATQTSGTPDSVTLTGARITVANDARVNATSEQQSRVNADGLNVGAAAAGASLGSATTAPDVRVQLAGATLFAGRDVILGSSAQGQSDANATASGGGVLVGGGATVSPTSKPSARLSSSSGPGGVPTRVTAGRALYLSANDGTTALGSATSPSYGFVSVGAATATGTQAGVASIDVGAGTSLTAGTDLNVSASESEAVVNGSVLIGFLKAGFSKAATSSFSKSSGVSIGFGDGAVITAGGRLTVGAKTDGTTRVESTAPIGQFLFKPALPSRASTAVNSATAVRLGNSSLSGRDVFLFASANEQVTNVGNGSTSIFTGGDVLRQNDVVGVSALVNSGSGFRLNAATLGVTANATGAAVNSETNGSSRTTINSLSQSETVSLNGQIGLSAANGAGAVYTRQGDGTALPSSTLTPIVTDGAITFGDITGITPRATARFDAGNGTVGGKAVITLDGRRLGEVNIVNLDQSRTRAIVLGKIDLTPMAVNPATAISYVGKTVSRYAVQTPAAPPVVVAVSNAAPNGDIVLTQPVVNPGGDVFLAAPRQILDGTTGAPSIVARSLNVTSGSLGSSTNRFDTQVGTLIGDAGSAAYVSNTGPLTVGDLVAKDRVDVLSTGALTVTGNVSASGGEGTDVILLHAVDSVGSGNDLTVLGTASVTARNVLYLYAGDSISVQSGATTTARFVTIDAAFQNAEPNAGAVVTFLGRLTTPAARVFLPGTDVADVFVVGPRVTADAADGTTVVVRSGKGDDVITVVRAEIGTTIDTGDGKDLVTIAADGGQPNVTGPVINNVVYLTSTDTDVVGYAARGFTADTQGRLTDTELTGVGMGPSGRVLFTSPVQLLLQLGSGADDLTIDGVPTGSSVTLFAGGGNDRVIGARATTSLALFGEAGNDLLVGGSAIDLLDGGVGNDLLIGREGGDLLFGQDGDDLLIAGSTAFDLDRAALFAVMAEWSRSDIDVATRVAHLRGQQSGGLNGSNTLTSSTVTNDAVMNTLTGGNGINWFFYAVGRDQVTDFKGGDFAN